MPLDEGTAAYILTAHPVVFLSSNSEDYEPGNVIRGIVVRADRDGASFTFAFMLKTDAGKME